MTFDDWWGAYPTQEDYEANCRDAWEASAASRDSEISELRKQLTSRDAEILELKNNVTICVVRMGELRQQVTLLRASVEELIPLNPHDTEHQYKVHHRALKALAATGPKP